MQAAALADVHLRCRELQQPRSKKTKGRVEPPAADSSIASEHEQTPGAHVAGPNAIVPLSVDNASLSAAESLSAGTRAVLSAHLCATLYRCLITSHSIIHAVCNITFREQQVFRLAMCSNSSLYTWSYTCRCRTAAQEGFQALPAEVAGSLCNFFSRLTSQSCRGLTKHDCTCRIGGAV